MAAGQTFILSGFSQKASWRQLSALWRRLVRNELMTGAAGPFFCVSARPLRTVSCSQQPPSLRLEAAATARSDSSKLLALQSSLSTRQMFPIPAPSLTARLSPHLRRRPSLRVDALPLAVRESPCGCAARHMAPSCYSRLISGGLADIKQRYGVSGLIPLLLARKSEPRMS